MPPSKAELAPHCADVCLARAGRSVQHCSVIDICPGTKQIEDYDLGGAREGFVQNCPKAENQGKHPELLPRINGVDSAVVYAEELPPTDELRSQIDQLYSRFDQPPKKSDNN